MGGGGDMLLRHLNSNTTVLVVLVVLMVLAVWAV